MRSPLHAIAAFLVLAPLGVGLAVGQQADQSKAPSPAPAPGPTSTADGDAAAKHAKLTACLKEAKAKKLVGAQKTAFVKDCVAAH